MRVPIRISSPESPNLSADIESAMVDTGATWTSVPRSVVAGLSLRPEGTVAVCTAAGLRHLEQSFARIELAGKHVVTHILVSDEPDTVLVGVTTLEALGFAVDPVNERLVETELLLL